MTKPVALQTHKDIKCCMLTLFSLKQGGVGWGVSGSKIPVQLHMLLSVKSFNVFVCLCIYVSICVSSTCACVCVAVPLKQTDRLMSIVFFVRLSCCYSWIWFNHKRKKRLIKNLSECNFNSIKYSTVKPQL